MQLNRKTISSQCNIYTNTEQRSILMYYKHAAFALTLLNFILLMWNIW
jgi:hypothetical protein